jgi:hypothetical protein
VRYREDILLPHVVPFLQAHPDMTLQHDIATSHTGRSVRDFLQDRNVSVLLWPVKSPDLNPIEHIWDLLDRRVRARAIPPRNVRELAGALVEEWGNISQQELANLVQSMRRRMLQYLMQLVATPDTDCYSVTLTPLCSGTHYSISASHMSVELVQFMSQLLNLVYLHKLNLLKINAVDIERTFSFLLNLYPSPTYPTSPSGCYPFYSTSCQVLSLSKQWFKTCVCPHGHSMR